MFLFMMLELEIPLMFHKWKLKETMSFKVNNDLNNIQFNFHNSIHFFGSMVMAVFMGFQDSYTCWVVYEFLDGFKPKWDMYKDKYYRFFSLEINWFRKEFLYSDLYSLQDLLIWNLCGAAIGHVIRMALRLLGVF